MRLFPLVLCGRGLCDQETTDPFTLRARTFNALNLAHFEEIWLIIYYTRA